MKTYFDISTGHTAQCNDRRMAWQMIHDKCKTLGHHPPLLNEVLQVVPVFLWESLASILDPEGMTLTHTEAAVIYDKAYQDFQDFEEWASEEHGATNLQCVQMYNECERTREEY